MASPLLYCEYEVRETGGSQMNATINETRLAGVERVARERETGEGLRHAQNALLSELPGVVVGLVTLFYIVTSLMALA